MTKDSKENPPGVFKIDPPKVSGIAESLVEFERYQAKAFPARSPQFCALEIAGECGELANLEKKIWRDPTREDCISELGPEAADIFISLANYCNSRGIDLEAEITRKLAKIELRRVQGLMGAVK